MSDLEDDTVDTAFMFGTPLDPLDPEDVASARKKPIPIEEQIVTDEQGRRRFHGAFTGGFSAGFFNTAGSRDGWAPKQFKSSRSGLPGARAEIREQKPEDFMDDEDRGEFGIAPRGLEAAKQFRRPTKHDLHREATSVEGEAEGPIPGQPVLEQLLRPSSETVGIRLLKAMGWRQGQGIGPRLTRRQKHRMERANKRMFGPSKPGETEHGSSDEDEEEELDPKYKDFLFAPDDLPEFLAKPKENQCGLGYKGLDRNALLGHINLFEATPPSSVQTAATAKKSKLGFRGQAFGVGAYEEDDEDIYVRDDMSRYDFELAPEAHSAGGGGQQKRKRSRWDEAQLEHATKCLEGFHLARKIASFVQKFPAPVIPKGFVPRARVRRSRFEPPIEEAPPTTNPSVEQRRKALELPRDLASKHEPSQQQRQQPTESEEQIKKLLSENASFVASGAGASFQPFARDAAKQKRYEQYLVCIKHGRQNALPILQPKAMPEWERDRERAEFERAAMLFRPMTGSMQSKFVSAGSSQDADDDSKMKVDVEGSTAAKHVSEARKAAELKMFGRLTREQVEWHPAKMLCIRFNVKHPYGDYSVVGVPKVTKSKFDLFNFTNDPDKAEVKQEQDEEDELKTIDALEEKRDETEAGPFAPVPSQEEEATPAEKPPLDLFKSIFLDSSDDEEQLPENKAPEKAELFGSELESTDSGSKPKPWEEKRENVLRNQQPAKGIFANIDFDALNRKGEAAPKAQPLESEKPSKTPDSRSNGERRREHVSDVATATHRGSRPKASDFFMEERSGESEAEFGPAKPASLPTLAVPKGSVTSESEDGWEEKKRSKKRKKEKKAKKAKKKKAKKAKKHSSKKKKQRKFESHSDSSTDSESSD